MMQIEYLSDKDIPPDKLIELYQTSKYNDWWTEKNVKGILDHCYLLITAWKDERLVGSVTVLSDGINYAQIDDLVVHPSFRNQSIGSKLLSNALEKINPLKLDFIQVIPVPGRESFFEKFGFKIVPDHKVMEICEE